MCLRSIEYTPKDLTRERQQQQPRHSPKARILPAVGPKVPREQGVQAVSPERLANRPASQSTQTEAVRPEEYFPAAQGEQDWEPFEGCANPGSQS